MIISVFTPPIISTLGTLTCDAILHKLPLSKNKKYLISLIPSAITDYLISAFALEHPLYKASYLMNMLVVKSLYFTNISPFTIKYNPHTFVKKCFEQALFQYPICTSCKHSITMRTGLVYQMIISHLSIQLLCIKLGMDLESSFVVGSLFSGSLKALSRYHYPYEEIRESDYTRSGPGNPNNRVWNHPAQ